MVATTNTEHDAEAAPFYAATRALIYHMHADYAHTTGNPACPVVAWAALFDSHARLFRRMMACFRRRRTNRFHCSLVTEVLRLSAYVRMMASCVASHTTRHTLEERLMYETIVDTYEEMSAELAMMYVHMMRHDTC